MWTTLRRRKMLTRCARGVHVVSPEEGYLACGMIGAGRLASVEAIAKACAGSSASNHDLENEL